MNDKFENFDQWIKLSREDQLRTLFDCPSSWRRNQVQHLWGAEACGYGECVHIPPGVALSEVAQALHSGKGHCSVKFEVKREYLSQMNLDEFHRQLKLANESGEFYCSDPDYADREYRAFNSWRNSNFLGEKEYIFTVEKFDENTLRFIYCTEQGDNDDEDGFGVEPDMWTSALFDFNGNIV